MGSKVRAGAVGFLFLLCFMVASSSSSSYTNTLQQGEKLRYGERLESSNQLFSLGFLVSDGVGNESFLAIWCNDQYGHDAKLANGTWPALWVGNRDNPFPVNSGLLSLGSNGELKIEFAANYQQDAYALYEGRVGSINASAILQDNGNFEIHELNSDGSMKRILWQSFDHPTDSFLPGMRLGINKNLTLSVDYHSPYPGLFTFGMNPNGTKELIIWRLHTVIWRSGIWQQNSLHVQYPIPNFVVISYNFSFIRIGNETFFTYTVNSSVTSFLSLRIDTDGSLKQVTGSSAFGELVSCFPPYEADFLSTTYGGCTKQELPNCYKAFRDKDISYQIGSMSTPGFTFSYAESMNIEDCKTECLSNCNCLAYAATNDEDDTGCEIWTKRVKFRKYNTSDSWTTRAKFLKDNSSDGRRIYILPLKENKWLPGLAIAVGGIIVLPSLLSFCYVIWKKCTSNGGEDINRTTLIKELESSEALSGPFGKPKHGRKDRNELHVFSFQNILFATDYFSAGKKLGEGGVGPVYKGVLNDGREVAIKRLSRSSGQGVSEFKNEAMLIAKLQHTNLVKLLGFCIQGEEKILIYEYLPNKSLDSFLFDPEKKKNLSWKLRFHIIEGIAQGMLYLHKYSRLRVIHRDLKASNILLDKDMNPKISDFGMARIFELNEEENTNRVVGTHGYMSPEYVFHGLVSVRTDVFSFGVLLLELVAGRKNTTSYDPEYPLLLTGHTWQLWNEGRGLEIIDPGMVECLPPGQILRCIHIGLLCVQDHAVDRPTMSDVVSMLANENTPLPEPKQPGFFINNGVQEGFGVSEMKPQNCSLNLVTITVMEAR